MFDTSSCLEPPVIAPPEEIIDCLVEDLPSGAAEPVRWSQYVPDGLLADVLAQLPDTQRRSITSSRPWNA